MRIGEALVGSGVITPAQLAEVLRAQVVRGARLGTNLVEHRLLTLDQLSLALARQQGVAAALGRQFDTADRELQNRLGADLAARYSCVPLAIAGGRLVLASCLPLDKHALTEIAGALGVNRATIVQTIAAEMRIGYQLERIYDIPREPRLLRTRSTSPRLGAPECERRRYVETLADLVEHSSGDPVVAIESVIGRVQVGRARASGESTVPRVDASASEPTLIEALASLARAADRDALALRLVVALARFVPAKAALLMCVRDEAAISWLGFRRDGAELPRVAVPFDRPGLVTAALRRKVTSRGASGDLGAVDYLLLASLGVQFGSLVVAPVVVDDLVVALVVLATDQDASVGELPTILTAAGAAFARLLGDVSGSPDQRGTNPADRRSTLPSKTR